MNRLHRRWLLIVLLGIIGVFGSVSLPQHTASTRPVAFPVGDTNPPPPVATFFNG